MSEEIRIYVADLAVYNNGKLHGVWIDATDELDDIQDQIKKMLDNSPEIDAEDYAIHDYEGFQGHRLAEFESISTAHEVACFIEENEEMGGKLLSHFCGNIDEAQTALENYCGCYSSLEDYAQELTEQTGEVPKHLEFYIDYEKMGRDMEINGEIYTIETAYDEVHIFWNH